MTGTRVHREIERKLEVPAGFRLPRLGGGGSGIGTVAAQPTLRLQAVYYDTDDLRLARHRITLRRRTGGGDDGWHLKLPYADESTRDEVQAPLAEPGEPPPALAELVLAITRGAALQPVATLRTVRRRWHVDDEHGRALAELTDDRVSVSGSAAGPSAFRELEVEAADGRDAAALDPVVAALVAAGAQESGFASKAVRALGARAAEPPDVPPPPAVTPRDPAGLAVHALLAQQVANFVAHDLRFRRGLPDAVHQMRVAARRMRSGLKVFAPLVDDAWASALRDELAWIAGELGAARDSEVLEARLLAGLAALDELSERDRAKASRAVHREVGHDHAAATAAVHAALRSPRYLALLDSLVDAARSPRLTEAAAQDAATALPPLMKATWRRLAKEVRKLHQKGGDDDWHEARIRAKRARYAAEAMAPVFGEPASKLAAKLSDITDVLGLHQDAAVATRAAHALASRKRINGGAGYALGLLHDDQRREMRAARRQIRKLWPKVAAKRRRAWLRQG